MINKTLISDEVQDYISHNIHADISKIVLQKSPFTGLSSKELAEQIQSKKAIQKKLPLWYNTPKIIYPPKLNLEQSSSEQTALYKSNLIDKSVDLIDLTGGFGVDDFYFAKNAKKVVHCELNASLSEIVKHNSEVLGADNIIFFTGDGLDYLKSVEKADVIYVDPSRRASAGRVFLLEDCEPNVVQNLDFMLAKADKIIIKAAPMLDIDAAVNQLKHVSEIHVVSLNNECKELLFVIEKTKPAGTLIKCAVINKYKTAIFSFDYQSEKTLEVTYSPLKNYLYEPDVAFLKAGLFKSITTKFNVLKIHQHSHLYTLDKVVPDFPGRTLKINGIQSFKDFSAKNTLKKANVIVRNFFKKPDELKKKFKIQDGGDVYLYFTLDSSNSPVVVICEVVFPSDLR